MGQWRAVIDLPATAGAPATARHLVTALLHTWQLPHLSDDAELVISELVTNAYLHAPDTETFELEVAGDGAGVLLSLADGSAVRPIIRELTSDVPSGRGMRIVERLADDWGVEDHPAGKRVWVRLTRPHASA